MCYIMLPFETLDKCCIKSFFLLLQMCTILKHTVWNIKKKLFFFCQHFSIKERHKVGFSIYVFSVDNLRFWYEHCQHFLLSREKVWSSPVELSLQESELLYLSYMEVLYWIECFSNICFPYKNVINMDALAKHTGQWVPIRKNNSVMGILK